MTRAEVVVGDVLAVRCVPQFPYSADARGILQGSRPGPGWEACEFLLLAQE